MGGSFTYALLNRMCSTLSLLTNSLAAFRTDAKLDRSNFKKIASLPVASFNSVIAFSAFSSLLAARYTFALCCSSAYKTSSVSARV